MNANLLKRFFAFAIDHLIFCMVAVLFLFITMDVNQLQTQTLHLENIVLFYLLFLILFPNRDIFRCGQSCGKLFLGLAVRDNRNKEQKANHVRLYLRNLLVILWPLELICLLTTKERFGDRITHCCVVNTPVKSRDRILVITCFLFMTAILFLMTKSRL